MTEATAPPAAMAVSIVSGSATAPGAVSPAPGAWIAAVLVALATAVLLLPARRGLPRGRTTGVAPAGASPSAPQRLLGALGSWRAGPPEPDLGLLLTEVASLLRAGATPQRAWTRTLRRAGLSEGTEPDDDGVPPALHALADLQHDSWLPRLRDGHPHWRPPPRGRRARQRRATAAGVPGAIASCRLSTALGAPLADILQAVAGGVAESGHAEASRRAALAGPRTTARLLACLPAVGLGLGMLVGADPAALLLDGGVGSALGVLGVVLMVVGHLVTRRFVRAATADGDVVDEALVLDLAAAALSAGASVPGVLTALGQTLEEDGAGIAGRALLLGADWEEAWEAPDDEQWRRRRTRLESCLRPGWEDGASPVALLEATAASLRAGRRASDEEAAERLAVRLVLPLGACHLPAFVILGIAPVVASVGMSMLTG
ncbi:hypothetical protein [Actinomyces sp. ZJ308]|uniref:type II secretion system F family protein n=1 Tax=Actinomyces sp. ZJ308 TaxID=2708342 RepID=UPI001FB8F9B5|nr:hypothetical protein [Actinomyces sp. ZJ308]